MREQVELLEHHAHVLADGVDVGLGVGNRLAVDQNLALRRLLKTIEATQERGLTRTGRPDHAHNLARLDLDVDALENMVGAKALFKARDLDFYVSHYLRILFSRADETSIRTDVMTRKMMATQV